jgi:hypothetical protein
LLAVVPSGPSDVSGQRQGSTRPQGRSDTTRTSRSRAS